jgi:hypothetical protein
VGRIVVCHEAETAEPTFRSVHVKARSNTNKVSQLSMRVKEVNHKVHVLSHPPSPPSTQISIQCQQFLTLY